MVLFVLICIESTTILKETRIAQLESLNEQILTVLLPIPQINYKYKIHRNPGYDIDFEHHYLNFEEIVYQEPLAIHVACPISANKLTG